MQHIIDFSDLPGDGTSFDFEGYRFGDVATTFILIDYPGPGMGPKLHRHPYAEVFIVQEGEALYTLGDQEAVVRAGQIVIAPPNAPHKFVSSGNGPLRQVDIHASPRFETEWLEEEAIS